MERVLNEKIRARPTVVAALVEQTFEEIFELLAEGRRPSFTLNTVFPH